MDTERPLLGVPGAFCSPAAQPLLSARPPGGAFHPLDHFCGSPPHALRQVHISSVLRTPHNCLERGVLPVHWAYTIVPLCRCWATNIINYQLCCLFFLSKNPPSHRVEKELHRLTLPFVKFYYQIMGCSAHHPTEAIWKVCCFFFPLQPWRCF